MATGIKKITESVIENGRSLIIIGSHGADENINYNDNNAIPSGAVLSAPGESGGTLRMKYSPSNNQEVKQLRIDADTTLSLNSVSARVIATDAVTTIKIKNQAVTSDKIGTNAVVTTKIANNAVTTDKIINGAITTAKLAVDSVASDNIKANAIKSKHIDDGIVLTTHLANNSVTTPKIAPLAVTHSKLSKDSVMAVNIAKDSIQNYHLSDECIDTSNIGLGAVTNDKINEEVFQYIDNQMKQYVDSKIAQELEIFKENNIPKNMVLHNDLNCLDGEDGSTQLVDIRCTGDIQGNRVFFITYQDLAEAYMPGEPLEPGDIVALREDGMVYKASASDACIVGVVSDEYANCLGATREELLFGYKVAVGMIGKVHVNVKGPVKLGQQINVSLSDYGVGCGISGPGIGKALETINCGFDEINKVLVQIRPM